jgi:hypothetical protein
MRAFAPGLLLAALIAILAPAAAGADDAWKTITLDGRSDFTIEIPAGVEPEAKRPKDQIMALFASAGDDDLFCAIERNRYTRAQPRAAFLKGLKTSSREIFCRPAADETASHLETLDSRETTAGAAPAALCATAYTRSGDKRPGIVLSALLIAAPDAAYVLSCEVSGPDQDEVEISWSTQWKDDISHMQNSLRLPASAK